MYTHVQLTTTIMAAPIKFLIAFGYFFLNKTTFIEH